MKDALERDFTLHRGEIITTEELTLRVENNIVDPYLKAEAFEHIDFIEENDICSGD